jgi:large-conductance mechanosensitive channel
MSGYIEIDIEEIGCVAQDVVQWGTLVNTLINFLF